MPNPHTIPRRVLAWLLAAALLIPLAGKAAGEPAGLVLGGNLHLRAQPSVDAQSLAVYYTGTVVTILGEAEGFYQVRLSNGDEGYMEMDFVAYENEAVVQTNAAYVNLRKSPRANGTILAEFTPGTHLTVHEISGDWAYVTIEGMQGYMSLNFIAASKPLEQQDTLDLIAVPGQTYEHPFAFALSETPARDAGEARVQAATQGNFSHSLSYPVLGIEAADTAISGWVAGAVLAGQEVAQGDPAAKVTLNGDYETHLVGDRYIGVVMQVLLTSESFANPVEYIYTLNVDRQTGALLNQADLFATNPPLVDMLVRDLSTISPNPLSGSAVRVNESWLQYALLTPQGIAVLLPRGEYLPTAFGTLGIYFTYDDLQAAGLLALPL